jgi:hypothetical protein
MGLGRRIWGTLHEPRIVTALMVATYGVVAAAMALILTSPRVQPWDVTLGCAVTIIGCLLGAPAAWRGWWGVEGPAAALAALGLLAVAVEDALRALTTDRWPGWPLLIIVALLLMIAQRMARTWGRTWEPGREPDTPLRRAQIGVTVAKAREADAAARAVERGDTGCGQPT